MIKFIDFWLILITILLFKDNKKKNIGILWI